MVQPHRIVIDFKSASEVLSYHKKIPNNIFKDIKIGSHDGYFRAVIELDGIYTYNITNTADGYMINLK